MTVTSRVAVLTELFDQLPYYSGLPLTDIESDPAVTLIIESLVELAHNALDIIVWKLSEELEKLAKVRDVEIFRCQLLLTLSSDDRPYWSTRH